MRKPHSNDRTTTAPDATATTTWPTTTPGQNPMCLATRPLNSVRRVSGFSYAPLRIAVVAAAALIGTLAASLAGGCSGPSTGNGLMATRGETAMVIADWNDVDAAVLHGVQISEMGIVETLPAEADRRVFRLRTIGDEPAVLIVSRSTGARATRGVEGVGATTGLGGPEGIKLEARVGRFGNREKEQRLVNAVRARLGRLSGVDYAPLP